MEGQVWRVRSTCRMHPTMADLRACDHPSGSAAARHVPTPRPHPPPPSPPSELYWVTVPEAAAPIAAAERSRSRTRRLHTHHPCDTHRPSASTSSARDGFLV